MSLEAIQSEIATWPQEMVGRLQGDLVALNHQRDGTLQRLSAKLDDSNPDRWVTLEEAEKRLGLNGEIEDEE